MPESTLALEERVESWRAKLDMGDPEGAWDIFLDQYRRLMLAVVRGLAYDEDDVADVFAHVCGTLSADGMSRLKQYRERAGARFSTWLVPVVHHAAVDWFRRRDGRSRIAPPPALSPLQQHIFRHVFVERRRHLEAFELMAVVDGELSFPTYLRELSETYRVVERARPRGVMRFLCAPFATETHDLYESGTMHAVEAQSWLDQAMSSLEAEDRAVLRLYVVEGLRAEDVARILGLRNGKAVYNRAYRSLAHLRSWFAQRGIELCDL